MRLAMRLGKLSGLASITAAAVALAAPAHADVDTDFANQLHGYGIYGAYCPDQMPVLTSAAGPR